MNTLNIKNLKKTYANGVTPINDVSLKITNGMFGLLGPNGAGKSSLMRTIAAIQKPDSGSIEFNGVDIIKYPTAIRKHLGYLPQEFGVYTGVSAYGLLDHIAILKGITNANERKEQVHALLAQVNLSEHKHKSVHTYSGGMKQRFGIAQALLGTPKIIIVDEPTAGLDPEERNRLNNLLSEIGEHIIVILSTHIVEDVRDLCTRMAIVLKGAIVTNGKPEDLITQLDGTIWTKAIAKGEFAWHKEHFHLISSRLNAGKINIHVRSQDDPGNGFALTQPSLEDVYFTTLLSQTSNTPNHV